MRQEMCVILGAASVKAYVASPKAFQVIGIVRFGLEYGLLATHMAGGYFRVNGSQVIALHTDTVLRAMDVARVLGAHRFHHYKVEQRDRAPVTVTVRKHRHYTAHAEHASH